MEGGTTEIIERFTPNSIEVNRADMKSYN